MMSTVLTDPEADRLARLIAQLTGETPVQVVRSALATRLEQEQSKRGQDGDLSAAVDAIVARVAALPVLDARSDEDILGYGEHGVPGR